MNKRILQMESLLVLAGIIIAYGFLGYNWLLFAVLLFVPDIAMVGYFINNAVGAKMYNLFHTYTIPLVLAAVGFYFEAVTLTSIGLIWTAHIAMDRAIGYGLKYAVGFKDTHLNRI